MDKQNSSVESWSTNKSTEEVLKYLDDRFDDLEEEMKNSIIMLSKQRQILKEQKAFIDSVSRYIGIIRETKEVPEDQRLV